MNGSTHLQVERLARMVTTNGRTVALFVSHVYLSLPAAVAPTPR